VRFLVLDAYPGEGRAALAEAGATPAGELYARMLQRLAKGAGVDLCFPADADDGLPRGVALRDYDGMVWTGSSLTIHDERDRRVRRQVELARAAYEAGVPAFGSCWAAQLAVTAAGGACAPNPKGREFGVARKVRLTDEGQVHPLFAGKPSVFDSYTSHQDEIVTLPPGGRRLAGNRFSHVQAVDVHHANGRFWAVQYHPEYDLHEVARLCQLRSAELVKQGTFRDVGAAVDYIDRLETLHADSTRQDLAFLLGLDEDVLDPEQRQLEVGNWLRYQLHLPG